jgi:hypothetical protein
MHITSCRSLLDSRLMTDLDIKQSRFGDNVTPYQEMASSLWAAGIESKRRLGI